MNRLTQDLLELSRLESRKVTLKLIQIPVHRLILQVYDRYRLDVEASGLIFGLCSPSAQYENHDGPAVPAKPVIDNFPAVNVDQDRIGRVFANLVFNSIKYTPQGGTIIIGYSFNGGNTGSALSSGSYPAAVSSPNVVLFFVKDSGSGISVEDLPHVFDRFYMGSKFRKSVSGSGGMGLAIAREIIEIHGGRIWAESAPGLGSTFYFTLPVTQTPCP